MSTDNSAVISGFVKPGFERVREAFTENFTSRNDLGAACCMYFQGEKVVDLWGGIRNKVTGDTWELALRNAFHRTIGQTVEIDNPVR